MQRRMTGTAAGPRETLTLLASLVLVCAIPFCLAGCSIRKFAIGKLGDALSEAGTTYASDDDPELVRDALPFSLKMIESLLDQRPDHRGLLLAAASGFTQYAYAFVQQDADEMEERDTRAASALRVRARRLYLRAQRYGLRGLEIDHPGISEALRARADAAALSVDRKEEVPLLYWTAAAWGLAISLSKDDPEMVADLGAVDALIGRALELDEGYDRGAIHEFLITYEGSRGAAMGGSEARAREHFDRAVRLSEGGRAAPFVALAESVSVGNQNRAEFVSLLEQALAIDPDSKPEWRLANLVAQRRARWLLSRADDLFLE